MRNHFDGLRTTLLLMTFYDFLIRHFKKKRKSHSFLKSEKDVKYVFSNTGEPPVNAYQFNHWAAVR